MKNTNTLILFLITINAPVIFHACNHPKLCYSIFFIYIRIMKNVFQLELNQCQIISFTGPGIDRVKQLLTNSYQGIGPIHI